MPTHRDITIELHSHSLSTILTTSVTAGLPEFRPPSRTRWSATSSTTSSTPSEYMPEFFDDAGQIVSVYVPALPGANFWIQYKVEDVQNLFPEQKDAEKQHTKDTEKKDGEDQEERLLVMKLCLGKTHVVTWNFGEKQEWQGKTVWALYEDPDPDRAKGTKFDVLGRNVDHMGGVRTSKAKTALQKRMLRFPMPPMGAEAEGNSAGIVKGDKEKRVEKKSSWSKREATSKLRKKSFNPPTDLAPERYIEIQVLRANGMKRIPTQVGKFDGLKFDDGKGKGIELNNGGVLQRGQPRRFYQFKLIDPKDEPLMRFRFFYRTYDELRALGVDYDSGARSENSSILTITPSNKSGKKTGIRGGEGPEGIAEKDDDKSKGKKKEDEPTLRAPKSSSSNSIEGSPFMNLKRLSIPPSKQFLPSQRKASAHSPSKRIRSPKNLSRTATPELALKQKGSLESMQKKLNEMKLDDELKQLEKDGEIF
ncbi:hypothetical protein NA57DRAFT_72716 [Rhizodiscina lignyota]|uniref:Uncharacterized protein n=1 Tax=Rhizodiscina lignyota TaxID=1504668 RepID=A0A9P4MD40_9PEZI|nr:hypothetical protein NA57DRAFT_72716 [Rhizodiscina lignyota]